MFKLNKIVKLMNVRPTPLHIPSIQPDIVNEKGKLEISKVKYDLNQLFNHTPSFDEPVL